MRRENGADNLLFSLCSITMVTAMTDRDLRPTDDDEVLFSLSFALQNDGKKRFKHANEIAAKIVARHLLEYLKQSNYVIMKGPPRQGHSTPPIRQDGTLGISPKLCGS